MPPTCTFAQPPDNGTATPLPGKYPQLMNSPGCETGPGPQLATWGKSTVCTVDAFGYKWHWTTNSEGQFAALLELEAAGRDWRSGA